ncbi:MAG: HAD-IA family hydrolase [Nitrososphaeria archaeon]
MLVKVLTFDLYGTLVDWKNSISRAIELICPNSSERFFENEFTIVRSLKSYTPYSKILMEVLEKTLAEKNVSYLEEYGRLIVTAFSKSPFFPDALLGLMLFKKKGYSIGIISNTEKRLIKITLAGVEDLFDYIVTAEDTGYYKPNKNAFTIAYEIMGVGLKNVVHISAYPQYDLETASELGVETVCLNRYGYRWKRCVERLDLLEEQL